jgi:hypothetical protein
MVVAHETLRATPEYIGSPARMDCDLERTAQWIAQLLRMQFRDKRLGMLKQPREWTVLQVC